MTTIPQPALDAILAVQFLVAWAGEARCEPRRLGWWDTDLVNDEGGGNLFARLAPRTAAWASFEAVREAAGEEAGLDRHLKANTVKRRTHSLFRQGLYWYHAIPNMRSEWLVPLLTAFDRIVREQAVLSQIFGAI